MHPDTIAWYEERYRRIGQYAAMYEAAQMLDDRLKDWGDKLQPEFFDGVPTASVAVAAAAAHDRAGGWHRFRAPEGYLHRVVTSGPAGIFKQQVDPQFLNNGAMEDKLFVGGVETIKIGNGVTDRFWAHELRVYGDCVIYACNLESGMVQAIEPRDKVGLVADAEDIGGAVYVDGVSMLAARYPEEHD
jgi:hypothetical protein